jgi:hypothetical protein
MSMKINEKLLSIPPYLSTTWSRINTVHRKGDKLVITLKDEELIYIPNLEQKEIDLIFEYHSAYLENQQHPNLPLFKEEEEQKESASMHFAFGSSKDGLNSMMMEHNPDQKDAKDVPIEVLQKIQHIMQIVSPNNDITIPTPEVGCNCFHCQIARALHVTSNNSPDLLNENIEAEEVSIEELQFQDWRVMQTGDQLFTVINCLDDQENYKVYLGQPIGCTCGKEGCEHILAVLKS